MKTFLGIGCGPIQTGIFLSFAAGADTIERRVVSEVDAVLVAAIRASGSIAVNVASADGVSVERVTGIEVLNPSVEQERAALIELVAEADELATALPSVAVYKHVAPILAAGFDRAPGRPRLVYAAENNNTAAEQLEEAVRAESRTAHTGARYLNTVIGKMSRVVCGAELEQCHLDPLTPGAARAHLVEAFSDIYISATGGADRALAQLIEKPRLLPFEEAKLYGHNAIHVLIGFLAAERGMTFMSEAGGDPELMAFAKAAFLEECGAALCAKWAGVDALFTPRGFEAYATELLARMTNPHLRDTVARICRDPRRKLGWDDRIVGTMRLALAQGVRPVRIARIARLALEYVAESPAPARLRATAAQLWPGPWTEQHETVWALIVDA